MKAFNKSIFFLDSNDNERFLFKCINIDSLDNLKFVFNLSNKGIIFSPDRNSYPQKIELKTYAELSYHVDGSILWKFPKEKDNNERKKRPNPHGVGTRRTPIKEIKSWEPFVAGKIYRYQDCTLEKVNEEKEVISNENIFNGDNFEFYLFLGKKEYATPPNNNNVEFIHRINEITSELDIILWFRKISNEGIPFKNSSINAINNNNEFLVIEPNFQLDESGAFELDLGLLNNALWNDDIINGRNLDMVELRKLKSRIVIMEGKLKENPYLNQIKELIGYNNGVAIEPNVGIYKLRVRMLLVFLKENDIDIFRILTY